MSVQIPHSTLISTETLNLVKARARAGALGELESLLWFRENVDDWKGEGVLMIAYTEYADAMGVSRDTLRRKIATIRNYSADDLVRWIENRISFEHMETANTLAELAKKTPKQLLNEAMNLGDENGQPMTVDRLTAFALGEQKREPALFRVNTILSRLGRFPLLLKWSSEKTDKFNSLMEAVREFFI